MCGKFGERTIIKFFLEKWSLSKVRTPQTRRLASEHLTTRRADVI